MPVGVGTRVPAQNCRDGDAHVGWNNQPWHSSSFDPARLQRKDAGASQSPAVQCHSLGLVTAAALAAVESHLHSRQKEQEGTGSSCRPKDHQVLCCKGEKPQHDSHRCSGWRLPQEGSLETSGFLSVLSRLHEPAMVLLYIHFQKSLKKATWSLFRFCNPCCILRYAPIILIGNTFSFTTSLLDLTVF